MFELPEHNIAFEGLKDGLHTFDYELETPFFEALAHDELLGGMLTAKVVMDKRPNMLVTDMDLAGTVHTHCDRCDGEMDLPLKGSLRQIFRMGGRDHYEDDEVVTLETNEHEVNLSNYFLECIALAMPLRRVHEEGACDPAVLEALKKVAPVAPASTDPRWTKLKAVKHDK